MLTHEITTQRINAWGECNDYIKGNRKKQYKTKILKLKRRRVYTGSPLLTHNSILSNRVHFKR